MQLNDSFYLMNLDMDASIIALLRVLFSADTVVAFTPITLSQKGT
jgi:hypothetical protein